MGYRAYYGSIGLQLIFHWTFALEYFKAVLRLPIILNIFRDGANNKIKRVKMIIIISNIVYYLGIVTWWILNKYD